MKKHIVKVSTELVDMSGVYSTLTSPEFGAQLVFVGVVRHDNNQKKVSAVTYEAHQPLAERIFESLACEAEERAKEPLGVVIIHRLGTLSVGEISTVIGVASAHRGIAYDASRYLIEELKKRAPIWKEEHYADGEKIWLDGVDLESTNSSGDPGGGKVISHG